MRKLLRGEIKTIALSGSVRIQTRHMTDGNEITSTMPSGDFVIGEAVIPFVLQRLRRGKLACLDVDPPGRVAVIVEDEPVRRTRFTSQGYVSVLIMTHQLQVYVYIKQEPLAAFRDAICGAAV
jgi:hypothetical protein